jgi:glycosyltransferase involved in cell wall biosynthesis
MSNNLLISIVLCTHNRAAMVSQTINCILGQKTEFPIELIIGEDCSTDGTREICLEYQRKYPDIIKVLLHNENCGLGKNWAILVKEAKGKYIASCDDDDYWHNPNKLAMQVNFLENNPDFGMVHTEYDILNVKKNKIYPNYYTHKKHIPPQGHITQEVFTGKSPICVSTSIFRKDLMNKYVPLDKYIEHKFNIQDWPTWMILSKYSKIGYLPVSTTTYRVGHYAISNYGSLEKTEHKVETDHKMYQMICSLLPDDVSYDEKNYNEYKLGVLLSAAYKLYNYKMAKEYIRRLHQPGFNNLKIKMTKNMVLFYCYAILLKLKKTFFKFKYKRIYG